MISCSVLANGVFLIRGSFILSISMLVDCYRKLANLETSPNYLMQQLKEWWIKIGQFLSVIWKTHWWLWYTLLWLENRHGRKVVYYIRNDLRYSFNFFPPEMENTKTNIRKIRNQYVSESFIDHLVHQIFRKLYTPILVNSIKAKMKFTYFAILILTSILIIHIFFKKITYFKDSRFLVT